jgi:8-oxo-dGTP diphosphatase
MTADTPVTAAVADDEVIHAAGCLVYRTVEGSDEDGEEMNSVEVLIVHRPKYDDWDFPKGKRESDESDLECAIRETREESGYQGVIIRELASDLYQVKGRDKIVRWWLMHCTGGEFTANSEVDEIRWLPPSEAEHLLSYGHARSLLAALPTSGDGEG